MCSVSAVFDYGKKIPAYQWDQKGWKEYQELIEKARKFDEIMNQPDCHDPAKAAWMREVEARLENLRTIP